MGKKPPWFDQRKKGSPLVQLLYSLGNFAEGIELNESRAGLLRHIANGARHSQRDDLQFRTTFRVVGPSLMHLCASVHILGRLELENTRWYMGRYSGYVEQFIGQVELLSGGRLPSLVPSGNGNNLELIDRILRGNYQRFLMARQRETQYWIVGSDFEHHSWRAQQEAPIRAAR